VPMNRNEAVTYLKELLNQCNDMSPNAVSFEQLRTNGSINYSVHIRGGIGESDKQIVRDIAKKQGFAVKDNLDGVIIFNST
jgi:hypothetical protein